MRAGRIPARIALTTGLLLSSAVALASDEFLSVRNYAPFARVFGLPGFADAAVLDPRQTSLAITSVVVNHSDIGSNTIEALTLDGESYITNLVLGFGVSDRLSVVLEVPWVAYVGGIFDGPIEAWHDLWGLPNGFRHGPNNELVMGYSRHGINEFELDSSGGGIGDVRLEVAYRLTGCNAADLAIVVRAGAKLPTGDPASLRGSGATDFSADLAIKKAFVLPRGELAVLAHGGVLLLGDGDVLAQLQRDTVGFAGAGAVWRLDERWRFNLQLYAQSSYFHSGLDALGADALSLTVGGSYTWVESKMRLSVGMIEDLITDTTPDVALQIELKKDFQ